MIWDDEPVEWEAEMAYACRGPLLHWCGYVGLPPEHPWFGKDYDQIEPYPEVHGGLTYSDDHKPKHESDGLWWIGFDCAHAGDLVPGLGHDGVYRSLEYVKQEITGLMRQAVEANRAVPQTAEEPHKQA